MTLAYSVFADSLSQTPVLASPLNRGRFVTLINQEKINFQITKFHLERQLGGRTRRRWVHIESFSSVIDWVDFIVFFH
jgi:hypothetical protein